MARVPVLMRLAKETAPTEATEHLLHHVENRRTWLETAARDQGVQRHGGVGRENRPQDAGRVPTQSAGPPRFRVGQQEEFPDVAGEHVAGRLLAEGLHGTELPRAGKGPRRVEAYGHEVALGEEVHGAADGRGDQVEVPG